jgi:hypothetical protein
MTQFEDVRRLLPAGAAALALCLGAGCGSLGGDDDDDVKDRSGGEVISGGGAADARPSAVPQGARVVESGGGDLDFTASGAGVAYIVDQTAGRVVVSQPMMGGQRLAVEPDEDRVTLDGRAVYEQNLERNNRHAVWWAPDATIGADAGGGDTVGTEPALPAELRSAQRVVTGMGDLSYTPPESGRIFVWDPRSRQIIHRAEVQRSDRVLVSPRSGTITVGSAARRQVQMDPDRPYEIYFERP